VSDKYANKALFFVDRRKQCYRTVKGCQYVSKLNYVVFDTWNSLML
jgi:hypothetical protein